MIQIKPNAAFCAEMPLPECIRDHGPARPALRKAPCGTMITEWLPKEVQFGKEKEPGARLELKKNEKK